MIARLFTSVVVGFLVGVVTTEITVRRWCRRALGRRP